MTTSSTTRVGSGGLGGGLGKTFLRAPGDEPSQGLSSPLLPLEEDESPLLDPRRPSRDKSDVDARFEPRKRRLRRPWNSSSGGSSNHSTSVIASSSSLLSSGGGGGGESVRSRNDGGRHHGSSRAVVVAAAAARDDAGARRTKNSSAGAPARPRSSTSLTAPASAPAPRRRPSAPTLFIENTVRLVAVPATAATASRATAQAQATPSSSGMPKPLGANPKDTGKKCRLVLPVPTTTASRRRNPGPSQLLLVPDPPPAPSVPTTASPDVSTRRRTTTTTTTTTTSEESLTAASALLAEEMRRLDAVERLTRAEGGGRGGGGGIPTPSAAKRASPFVEMARRGGGGRTDDDVDDKYDGCDNPEGRFEDDGDDDTRSSTSVPSLPEDDPNGGTGPCETGVDESRRRAPSRQPEHPQHRHKQRPFLGASQAQAQPQPSQRPPTLLLPLTATGRNSEAASGPPSQSSLSLQGSSTSAASHSQDSSGGRSSNTNSNNNPYVPHHLVDLDNCGDEEMHAKRVREVLRRPFGRNSLGKLARQYCVVVNPPELGPVSAASASPSRSPHRDGKVWRYRVWVQQPHLKQAKTRQALTTALIDRTLSDFFFLERSLRDEYHGAALVPSLHNYLHQHHQQQQSRPSPGGRLASSAAGTGPASVPNPPPQPLQDFLADLMNGIRGHGEFYIPPDHVLKSRSLEAFLYKSNLQEGEGDHNNNYDECYPEPNDDAAAQHGRNGRSPSTPGSTGHSAASTNASSSAASSYRSSSSRRGPRTPASRHPHQLHDAWLQYIFRPLERFCGGVESTTAGFFFLSRADEFSCGDGESTLVTSTPTHDATNNNTRSFAARSTSNPNDAATYWRDGGYDDDRYQGRYLPNHRPPPPPYSSSNVIHCELLEAESALLASCNSMTGSLLDKIQRLDEVEMKASQHWRRLATCLQTIFVAEKDTENVKLDDQVRVKSPFRKVPRAPVESAIQALASCYSSRYSTSYESLRVMLVAFSSDLDSIPLAMASYRAAMERERSDDDHRDYEEEDDAGRDPNHRTRLVLHETWLRHTLTAFCRSLPIRTSRMAWRYWNTSASQCAALANSATLVSSQTSLDAATSELVQKQASRHVSESRQDDEKEMDLVGRVIAMNAKLTESDAIGPDRSQRPKVLTLARQRVGRWDSQLSLAIMGTVGVANASLEETMGRDLKRIRKYAIGLRDQLSRCMDCVKALQSMSPMMLMQRKDMLFDMSKLFSGKPTPHAGNQKRSVSPSMAILARAGVDTTDPLGWSAALPNYDPLMASPKKKHHLSIEHAPVGELALAFLSARDGNVGGLLESLLQLLKEYFTRVEVIEGYVYMECVGIQLERHFSQKRASALADFEKKTDITAALNIANRKRLHKLKEELQEKLDHLGDVSHTVVKETKELHLESKNLKVELHDLAIRRLTRARETSTERIVQILSKWAKDTEVTAATELKALGEAMATLERAIGQESALFYPPKSE